MEIRTTAFSKLLVMFVIALLVGLLSNVGVFNPLQEVGLSVNLVLSQPFVGLLHKLDDAAGLVANLQQTQVENLQLKSEVAELHQQIDALKDIQAENASLTTQLNLQLPKLGAGLICQVVRYEYVPAPGYVYIRVGLSSGVAEGDLAVRYNYIAGQVVKVLGEYAKVRLLTATDSKFTVKVGPRGVVGQLTGDAGLNFSVINIDQSAEINAGDNILLVDPTGEDSRNLTFGQVGTISGLDSEATKTIQVSNPVDMNKLDYLVIIPSHV